MSRENVELVRRHFEFWNARHDPDALADSFWHDDLEWEEPPDSPDATVFRGRSAATRYMRQWLEHMGEIPVVVEDLLPAGEEVIAQVRLGLRGSLSGAAFESPIYYVLRIRDGRIDRIRPFYRREHALETVGLRE